MRRRVEVLGRRLAGHSDALEIVALTPAWSGHPRQVAVLIPSYGHADVLPEALDSVWPAVGRAGSPVSVEVVVVDDGSPDRAGDIALNNVDTVVMEGDGLPIALLGMSFLNRTDIKREGEIMTLTKRY